ncbi:MAG: RecX family transcriptional regulator [Anaerolineaceae bacterium]|nr:RecX family transcriptional regulator [Anaerolineaceae bacterium]
MEKVITAIKVQKRNPQRVSIDLDGEYAFGLARMTAAWLKVGDVLSEERVVVLQREDAVEVAFQRALRLIGHRPRSEQEVSQRLAKLNFSPDQVEQVIAKLKASNLIEDEKFARMWVENRLEFHPRSLRLIRYELLHKGIAEEHIEQALQETEDEQDLARRAAVAYARRLENYENQVYRNRLSGYLARRGFSYGTIAPLVNELLAERELTRTETDINLEDG